MEVWQQPQEVLGFELVEQEREAGLTHLFVHPLNLYHLITKSRTKQIVQDLLSLFFPYPSCSLLLSPVCVQLLTHSEVSMQLPGQNGTHVFMNK